MTEPESREDVIHTIQTTPGDLDFENFAVGAVEHQTKKIWECKLFCSAPRGKSSTNLKGKLHCPSDLYKLQKLWVKMTTMRDWEEKIC